MNPGYGVLAGIEVHKRMLAVVAAVLGGDRLSAAQVRDQLWGTGRADRRLSQQQVSEIAMESTAQDWRRLWLALEGPLAEIEDGVRRTGCAGSAKLRLRVQLHESFH